MPDFSGKRDADISVCSNIGNHCGSRNVLAAMTTPTPNELARVAARRGITLGYEIARFDREWVQRNPVSATDDVGGSEYIDTLASHLGNIFSFNRSAGNMDQVSLTYSEAREIAEWRFPCFAAEFREG
jgi:hypothetical protein